MKVNTDEEIVASCKEKAKRVLKTSRLIPFRTGIAKLNDLRGCAVAVLPVGKNGGHSLELSVLVDTDGVRSFGKAVSSMFSVLESSKRRDEALPRVTLTPYTLETADGTKRVLLHTLIFPEDPEEFFGILQRFI